MNEVCKFLLVSICYIVFDIVRNRKHSDFVCDKVNYSKIFQSISSLCEVLGLYLNFDDSIFKGNSSQSFDSGIEKTHLDFFTLVFFTFKIEDTSLCEKIIYTT